MITSNDNLRQYEQLYQRLLGSVEDAYEEAENNEQISDETFTELKNRMGELYEAIPDRFHEIREFAAFVKEQSGVETTSHATNTALYKAALLTVIRERSAPFLEHRERSEDVEALTGMALHDIGKRRLENDLVNMARELTDEEYEQIKDHTDLGVEAMPDDAPGPTKDIIKNHHERPDGSGYENKEELHAYEQLSGMVDVFDALTSDRSYHEARTAGETAEFLEKEFGGYNNMRPALNAFYDTLTAFPSGQLVRHESGAILQVEDPDRQSVRTVYDESNSVPEAFEVEEHEIQHGIKPETTNYEEIKAIEQELDHETGDVERARVRTRSNQST